MFEGSEHSYIGNSLQLKFPDGSSRKSKDVFFLHGPQRAGGRGFTFGQIIAMAGDFYTNRPYDAAISGGDTAESRGQRFAAAVNSMTEDKGEYIGKLDDLLKKENEVLFPLMHSPGSGDGTARAYHVGSNGMPGTTEFKDAVGSIRYGKISVNNFDHFGNDALSAYIAGHRLARNLARAANTSEQNMEHRIALANNAYIHEAFACHYLTDLFSSGHLRVDRKIMHSSAVDVQLAMVNDPIWDNQAHYMHDDDSATGLLVKDGTGFQWIAYGDKQLFEGHSTINLSRMQASVDDLAHCFLDPDNKFVDTETFDHLKWLPIPQRAAVHSDTGALLYKNSEIYSNTCPLWKSAFESGKPASMGYRAGLNDHSRHAMQPGSLGGTNYASAVPPECNFIFNARFRGESQYPQVKALRVLSGGFLQLQTLPTDDNTELTTYLNIWGPLSCNIGTDTTPRNAFSLRWRAPLPNRYKEALLHTLVRTSWAIITVTQVYYDSTDQALCFFSATYDITGNGTKATKMLNPDDPKSLAPTQPWEDKLVRLPHWQSGESTEGGALLSDEPAFRSLSRFLDFQSANISGFIALTFSTKSNSLRLCVAPVIDGQNPVRQGLPWYKLVGSEDHFVKKIDDRVVAVRHRGTVIDYTIFEYEGWHFAAAETFSNHPTPESVGSKACALVAKVGPKHEPGLLLVTEKYSSTAVQFAFRTCAVPNWWFENSLQEFTVTYSNRELVRPLFYAVSYGNYNIPGFDCIQASTVKISGKVHTCIRVFHWDPTTKFGEPVESLIPDSLYDATPGRAQLPMFYSLNWQRCSTEHSTNCLMEVFSYYGVLGARVYAPTDPSQPYRYTLYGQVPYLGQPSYTTGLGSSARWGQSIMQYHTADDLDDIQYWVRGTSANYSGSYGVTEKSKLYPLMYGYKGNRPGWTG